MRKKKKRPPPVSYDIDDQGNLIKLVKVQGVGRPTDYREHYAEQTEKLCKLGAADEDLATFFEVTVSTISLWKLKHPKFSEAIKAGKDLADANIAESLYQRAKGFEHDSEEIKVVSDGSGMGSSIERIPIRKVYPPDTAAAIFWLKNRQRHKWRDKTETAYTDPDGNPLPVINVHLSGVTVKPPDMEIKSDIPYVPPEDRGVSE
jgi:hypothetical protein